MALSFQIKRLRKALGTRGPWKTLRLLGPAIYHYAFPIRIPTHPFDLQHGVDTSGLLHQDKIASGHANDDHITAYWGTHPAAFQDILKQWQKTLAGTPFAIEDYTLFDIGCGKGRVVMMASDAPFRRVVGIELSPMLVAIAHRNLATWKRSRHLCSDISILNCDALEIDLPQSPALLYAYNPFDEHVTRLFLDRLQLLALARSAPIDLIYAQPELASIAEAAPGIALIGTGSAALTQQETAADAFSARILDYRIYRIAAVSNHAVPIRGATRNVAR
jgi:SAM-dependent methyltransferase